MFKYEILVLLGIRMLHKTGSIYKNKTQIITHFKYFQLIRNTNNIYITLRKQIKNIKENTKK